jgi:DNA-binding NarL/FixJ family response regulator
MIQLALVDDHEITRKGIRSIIELNKDIKVVLEASNGKDLLDRLSKISPPEIVILDIQMPVMNGFDTVKALQAKYPEIKIIVFSLILEEDTIINMISSGASAYISKNADPSSLARAVITVHSKGFYLCDQVKKEYFRKSTGKKRGGFNGKLHITPKEIEFIKLAATNLNYKEIAEIMELSPKTVENYRDSLFLKLEIKNRAALVFYGLKNGMISIFPE